jgi:hypothetical protein
MMRGMMVGMGAGGGGDMGVTWWLLLPVLRR